MDGPPPSEIVIVAPPRLGDAARDAAFSVVRIDPNGLAVVPRVDEVLQAAPGASLFRRSTSLVANATIQGASLRAIAPSGAGRALVTLEAAPLNDPFGGWVIWSAVPVESIERVDIVRGAGAGPYGAGALTGVIALREAPAPADAQFNMAAGEAGYGRGAVFAGFGPFTLAAAAEHSDGVVPVRNGAGAADTNADFTSRAASLRWLSADGDASVRLSAYDEERGAGLVGAESEARGVSFAAAYAVRHAGGGWRAQIWATRTDFANSSVAVAADRSATTPANDQYETPAWGAGGNLAYRVRGEAIEWELGADVRYAEGETREYFGGATLPNGRIAGGSAALAGVYGELSYEAGSWLTTGGLRVDYSAAFDGHRRDYVRATGAATLTDTPQDSDEIVPSARFGLRRDLGDVDLRAAAYSSFRPPTLNELHRPFRVGNDTTLANPALSAERLYGAEIGADGERWSVTVFYNRLDEAIGNKTIASSPAGATRQRDNLGRIEAFGIEADLTWPIADDLDLRAGLAATDAELTRAPQPLEGLRPAQAPEYTASLGAAWRFLPRATLIADARWEGPRWEDDLNTRRLSASLNVDARLSVEIAPRLSLELAAENLLDGDIETGESADGVESFAPERRLSIGLSVR